MTGDEEPGGRPSRWDRPPPPHDWRWFVGTTGKVLIAVGLLMFGFVAYQLWGTGLEYAQAQDRLDDEFEELLASVATAPTVPGTTRPEATTTTGPRTSDAPDGTSDAPASTSVATTVAPTVAPASTLPDFAAGDVVARIEIPGIGLDAKVVSGVQPADLKAGPGHYPGTPMPGQLGNSAIAGHRTTYGQPFFHLDEVDAGDEIVLTTVQGRFVYRATSSEVVGATRSDVIATTDPTIARLTLTTCHPRYTAAQRLIVHADLDAAASAPTQPAVIVDDTAPAQSLPPAPEDGAPTVSSAPLTTAASSVPPTTAASSVPPTTAASSAPLTTTASSTSPTPAAEAGPPPGGVTVSDEVADAFAHGWFSDDAAWPQVALWGFVLTFLGIGSYLLSRASRNNWVGALAGVVPFVVALYFFFQNVNRLLPAAL